MRRRRAAQGNADGRELGRELVDFATESRLHGATTMIRLGVARMTLRLYQAKSWLSLQGMGKFYPQVEPGELIGLLSESESESAFERRSYANAEGLRLIRAARRQLEQIVRMLHTQSNHTCCDVAAMAVCTQ